MDVFDPLLALNELEAPLRWASVFGNTQPVEFEIGAGKASLLRRMAAAAPDHNFVGIERALKYLRIAAHRVARDRQTNVRLVRADALYFLERFVPAESVAVFHIYFIDPWPKKRHAKRRFFRPATVRLIDSRLAPGGVIHIRTDVDWYFADVVELYATESQCEILDKGVLPADRNPPEMQTNYEIKYRAVGKAIYGMTVRKPADLQPPT